MYETVTQRMFTKYIASFMPIDIIVAYLDALRTINA